MGLTTGSVMATGRGIGRDIGIRGRVYCALTCGRRAAVQLIAAAGPSCDGTVH
jgi:hypothetical protein